MVLHGRQTVLTQISQQTHVFSLRALISIGLTNPHRRAAGICGSIQRLRHAVGTAPYMPVEYSCFTGPLQIQLRP